VKAAERQKGEADRAIDSILMTCSHQAAKTFTSCVSEASNIHLVFQPLLNCYCPVYICHSFATETMLRAFHRFVFFCNKASNIFTYIHSVEHYYMLSAVANCEASSYGEMSFSQSRETGADEIVQEARWYCENCLFVKNNGASKLFYSEGRKKMGSFP
jgi:Zn-finger protein